MTSTLRVNIWDGRFLERSLTAQWLRRASHGHEMCCSWSGGHGFEPSSGRTWDAYYFCLSCTWAKNKNSNRLAHWISSIPGHGYYLSSQLADHQIGHKGNQSMSLIIAGRHFDLSLGPQENTFTPRPQDFLLKNKTLHLTTLEIKQSVQVCDASA